MLCYDLYRNISRVYWTRLQWLLKSTVTRLFFQRPAQINSNENIKASHYKGAVIWKAFLSWRRREFVTSLRAIPDNDLSISRAFSRSKVIGSTSIRHRSDTKDSHVLENGCSLLRGGVWYHLSNTTVYIHPNISTFTMLFPIPRYIEPRYRKPTILTSMTPDDDLPRLLPAL